MPSHYKLSLCFVTREYPPETDYGGIGTYYYDVGRALARRGHTVVVLSETFAKESYHVHEGVHVYRIRPRFSLSKTPVLWRAQAFWSGYRLSVALKLIEIVRHHKVALIESPELHAETYLYSLIPSHRPLVVRLHSGTRLSLKFNPQPMRMRFRVNIFLEDRLVQRASAISAPSHAVVSLSRENGMKLPATCCSVIPNMVDCDIFAPTASFNNVQPNVFFAGRLEFWKGADLLCAAIPKIVDAFPETIFCFAGTDPLLKGGIRASEALKDSVPPQYHRYMAFLGKLGREQLIRRYQAASVVVVPSRWESFGLVCAEAMACGKPVIATNVGGLSEIVEDGISGFLVEVDDVDALVRAISRFLTDADLRTEIGANARQRILRNYSLERICGELERFYAALV